MMMMTKQDRQQEIDELLAGLAYLKNGGNDYSHYGRERTMLDPFEVTDAIAKLEYELSLVLSANYD